MFLLYFTTISTMSSSKGESENSEITRMGRKRVVMKKRTVTHIQVKIVLKRRNQT
jgi:hypothetical protein